MTEGEVFPAVGEDGFERLVAAFYKQIPGDPILGPMYPADDLAGAEERLREYLIYRFGGPERYIEARGHPRLRARHMQFPITVAASDRWFELMTRALAEASLPREAEPVLRNFFSNMATFLRNRE